MDFYEQLEENKRSKAPVRNSLADYGPDIQVARENGNPLNAVYKALKKSGVEAGKNYSSFHNAIKWLDKNGWPHEQGQSLETPIQPAPSSSVPEPIDVPAVTREDDRSHTQTPSSLERQDYSDQRHKSDF